MYYSGAPFAFKENKNVRSLLAYISKKGFSVGNKLPPERELAEQLGISRNSLREALKVLEAMDVVEIRHGSGIFLRKEDTQPDDGSSLWLMIHKDEILNILTVREALDLKAIDLIPEEDYPRLRDEMKACIAAVRKTDMTNEDMLRHDLEFHNIIRRDDLFRQHYITFHIGVHTFRHHLYDSLCHFLQKGVVFRLPPV